MDDNFCRICFHFVHLCATFNISLMSRRITLFFCFVLVAATAASYALGFPSMTRDLSATQFQATVGLSMYTLGFGVVPLVTASFSEEFGRRPLYLVSGLGFAIFYVMIAEYVINLLLILFTERVLLISPRAKNVQTVMVARLIQGSFGSTAATMVGGTIADIWAPAEYVTYPFL